MDNTSNQSSNNQNSIIVAVVISTIAIIGSVFAFSHTSPSNSASIADEVSKKIDQIEADKVGGQDNYEILKKIYASPSFKSQQKQSLETALAQMGGSVGGTDTSGNASTGSQAAGGTTSSLDPSFKEGTIDASKIADLKKDTYIKGNKDAKILWIEYSDVQCPYCKKFHQAGTVEAVMNQYKDQIAYTMHHFPLSFHQYAQRGAETLECIGEVGGNDKFFEFETKVFALTDDPTPDNMTKIATDMKIDTKKLNTCIDSGKYKEKITAQMNAGQSLFSVQGTPGNVIINVETGKWVLVPGAYPASEIERVVDYMNK